MSVFAALAAGLALSAPADVLADLRAEDRADLQCMAVTSVALGNTSDERLKAALVSGVTFYYGRLQGRSPGTNWLQRFEAYIRTEPMAELEANRPRCAAELQVIGEAFNAVGAAMSKG